MKLSSNDRELMEIVRAILDDIVELEEFSASSDIFPDLENLKCELIDKFDLYD